MGVIYSSIDSEQYNLQNNGTCILSGWCGSEDKGSIDIVLKCDNEEISLQKLKFYERPDVFKICKTLSAENKNVGFELSFSDLNLLLVKYENVQVIGKLGENHNLIWEKSSDAIKQEFGSQTIIKKIDSITKHAKRMVINGWVIDTLHEDNLIIENEQGEIIPSTCKRIVRPDVCKTYGIKNDRYACGFEISVNLNDIQGDYLAVHYKNALADKYTKIDLKKFAYENSPQGRRAKFLSWSRRSENLRMIREHGLKHFNRYMKFVMEGDPNDYEVWRTKHMPSAKDLENQRKTVFQYRPLVSIVIPLYNTPIQYLKELLESIVSQTYSNWELCMADGSTDDKVETFIKAHYSNDKRIRYQMLDKNLGIAGNTNAAADMARGDYVMLCDHDDLITEDALFEMVKVINQDPDIDIVYSDEDLVSSDSSEFFSPRFKPDFNFDFLRSINYICHIFMVRKKIMDETGYFREEFDGAQDFDLILRCCEKTKKIYHVPKVLYHWRAHQNSTAGNPDSKEYAIKAGQRALEEHYQRMGYDAKVEYTDIFIMFKTIMAVHGDPKVSIIICTKDHTDDLDKCIRSIVEKSTWKNYEIIVVENNSEEKKTFAYYEKIQKEFDNIKVVIWDGPFNYSAINNFGIKYATGDFYVLMNNDIEVITPDWMEQMLGYCQRSDVGMVGAKLYYPDDTVQHAGAVIGVGGFAGHVLTGEGQEDVGYFGRLKAIQDISAVTAALVMVKKSSFERVHGLDEKFQVALNDMDLCLKIRKLGELIVFNPWVEMYHYESKSRGMENTPEKHERFKREIARFRSKWKGVLDAGDTYYNPNLTLMRGDCSLRGNYEFFDIIDEIAGDKRCRKK